MASSCDDQVSWYAWYCQILVRILPLCSPSCISIIAFILCPFQKQNTETILETEIFSNFPLLKDKRQLDTMTRVLLAQEESTIAILTGSYNNNNKLVKTKMFWSNAVFFSKKPFPNVQNNVVYTNSNQFSNKKTKELSTRERKNSSLPLYISPRDLFYVLINSRLYLCMEFLINHQSKVSAIILWKGHLNFLYLCIRIRWCTWKSNHWKKNSTPSSYRATVTLGAKTIL